MPGFQMDGILYHGFAAMMTLTVISFPTPQDLWNSIRSPFGQDQIAVEVKFLPALAMLAADREGSLRLDEIRPLVTACLDGDPAGGGGSVDPNCDALAVIAAASAGGLAEEVIAIRDPAVIEAASAHFCRAKWAEARSRGQWFTIEACLPTPGVANVQLSE